MKLLRRRGLWIRTGCVLAVVVVSAVFMPGCYRAFRVPTTGMEPAIARGQTVGARMFVFGLRPEFHRGDIVVFRYPPAPDRLFVKRIVGVAGDTVEVREKALVVNGRRVDESYVIHTDPNTIPNDPSLPEIVRTRDNLAPVLIPPGKIFVLGDNRDQSVDSRLFGPLSVKEIIGIVRLR